MVEGLHGDFHPFGVPILWTILHRRVLFGEARKCWELVEGSHTGIYFR